MPMNDDKRRDQEVLELLKDYPMPEAATGFYDQALLRAVHRGTRQQRKRWMLTGFGAAIAASLAVWVVGGMLLRSPDVAAPAPAIAGVTMTLEEPRTVNFVFESAEALDTATLTVSLPDGIELQGFPGQREITWETSLVQGKNLLPLTLVALTPTGGELLARLEHDKRGRTFRLQLNVDDNIPEGTSG